MAFMKFIHSRSGFVAFLASILASMTPMIVLAAKSEPATVIVSDDGKSAELPARFLGLSYEASMVLSKDGRYYFDPKDEALVNTFQTLGVKSLRVGANAVDDPRIAVPQEPDIDMLFAFARAAGVKVIYSFRLKNGDPQVSARLARHIMTHYSDSLECFAVGNEPNFYCPTFDSFFAQWKPRYDAILKAVPEAMFDGPGGSGGGNYYALELAKALFADKHLAIVSDHYYFLGSGREAEKDPAASRARFLSNRLLAEYEHAYEIIGARLAAQGVPYRIDELNSCYNGGAKDSSDTYASTLWALDCTHWWAARHILGMNYHTGESVGRDGQFGAANYAAFVHQKNGNGFTIRPQGYAMLAFSQGAHGRPLSVTVQAGATNNFTAYAYRDAAGAVYLTLINKNYGPSAQIVRAALHLPQNTGQECRVLELTQRESDVSAKTGVQLGGSSIGSDGTWGGQWRPVQVNGSSVDVPPASAWILRFASSQTVSESHAMNAADISKVGFHAGKAPGSPVRRAKTGHLSNYDESKVGEYTLPDPLKLQNGQPVRDAETWYKIRRPEILKLYRDEIYGNVPPQAPKVTWEVLGTNSSAMNGLASEKELAFHARGGSAETIFHVHVLYPAGNRERVPVLLHLVFSDRAQLSTAAKPATPPRSQYNERSATEDILRRGYAYATVHYTEIEGDLASNNLTKVRALALAPGQAAPRPDEWGTISAWAWGLTRVLDYFETDPAVDATRVAVVGHSRLGKTALWAGASDARFALVFSSCAGEMGSSLARRDYGEVVDDMAENFPWQFAGNFQKYDGHWNDMPVDAHMLIALNAPRPVFITGGTLDQWADPRGEYLAVIAAGPVYRLLGALDLGTEVYPPPIDTPLITGDLGFHYHTGAHIMSTSDWKAFLDFADAHLKKGR